MDTNMNFPAPLAVVAFIGAVACTLLAICALILCLITGRKKVARIVLVVTGVGAVIYLGLLFGFSLGSREKVLAQGQEKYFCEIDCHLAYSVLDVRTQAMPSATRYVVTLRTRFDENTIASWRPRDLPLTPSPRTVHVLDREGRRYEPASVTGAPLAQELIPGAHYTTELAFDVPAGAQGLRLLVGTTAGCPDRMVIGDENSWLHKKTYFAL